MLLWDLLLGLVLGNCGPLGTPKKDKFGLGLKKERLSLGIERGE